MAHPPAKTGNGEFSINNFIHLLVLFCRLLLFVDEADAFLRKRNQVKSIVRPRLYGEKLSRVEGSFAYPSYPGRANFSYISLQNLANRLHEKQKVGSAGRVTRLAGSPS